MNGYREDGNELNHKIQLYRIKPKEHFIEAQIQDGDTLQAIALRFHCSISELKRINQIHKDNEIFAKRTIKVPVTPYSVLTELIPTQPPEPQPSTSSDNATSLNMQSLLQNSQSMQNQSNTPKDVDLALDCNAMILNSTIAPSVIPFTDSEQTDFVSEDTQLLPSKEKVSVETVVVKELTAHGADFGLKWFHLLCFVLLLGVVVPLVYVLFYLDKHEHADLPPLYGSR
ncbi:lysM and putative peptidoglycan-binding domain-containing protein 3 isoform X2 [Aricia agestis]|nr:lysM and putative peptidoglycan-binding domain-containing protein 3 isoform X2 [Aricia agestis]